MVIYGWCASYIYLATDNNVSRNSLSARPYNEHTILQQANQHQLRCVKLEP